MNPADIPRFNSAPVLGDTPQQAFRIDPESIIHSIKQQFSHRALCFRELGQNSADSDSTSISVTFKYQEDPETGKNNIYPSIEKQQQYLPEPIKKEIK